MIDIEPSRHLDDMEIDNVVMGEKARAAFESFYLNEPSFIDIGSQRFGFEDVNRRQLEESFALGLIHGLRHNPLANIISSNHPYEQRFEEHGHTWGSQYVAGQD